MTFRLHNVELTLSVLENNHSQFRLFKVYFHFHHQINYHSQWDSKQRIIIMLLQHIHVFDKISSSIWSTEIITDFCSLFNYMWIRLQRVLKSPGSFERHFQLRISTPLWSKLEVIKSNWECYPGWLYANENFPCLIKILLATLHVFQEHLWMLVNKISNFFWVIECMIFFPLKSSQNH